ncbi:6-carboxytetrahydropterin synthase [Nocardioides aestuarii]|uniref:6-carboxy-5,6,7,8-tetrahydropterin synthase n=1 Tax=Nocardioides aestuarii TaxID=252231 RepID=A0ABW4TLB8_9ACTN
MFSVTVRNHVMVAHSLPGEVFGPAQRLHGATYAVEATFRGPELDGHGMLVDIGAAAEVLKGVLADLDYRNLDDLPEFAGVTTTTEVVARHVTDRLCERVRAGVPAGTDRVSLVSVVLHESPTAAAGYERAP